MAVKQHLLVNESEFMTGSLVGQPIGQHSFIGQLADLLVNHVDQLTNQADQLVNHNR